MGQKRDQGFSLVELLIVLTIVGILTVTILVMINPAETIKRVKDELRKTDINALLSSIDIYYLGSLRYPWGEYGQEFFAEVIDPRVGVCDDQGVGENGCVGYGDLIKTANIKDIFSKREYFRANVQFEDKLFVVSPENEVPSVCYIPLAKGVRGDWENKDLDLRVLNFDGEGKISSARSVLCADKTEEPKWTSLSNSCFECIPLKLEESVVKEAEKMRQEKKTNEEGL